MVLDDVRQMSLGDRLIRYRSKQCCFVHYKRDVRRGISVAHFGQLGNIYILRQGTVSEIHLKEPLAHLEVGCFDLDEQVETSCTKSRRVNDVFAVGSTNDENSPLMELILLHEELAHPVVVAEIS